MRVPVAALLIGLSMTWADAREFRLEEVPSIAGLRAEDLKPGVVIFTDRLEVKSGHPATAELTAFEDWARERPVQRRFLSLTPEFEEPVLKNGRKLKLSIYLAQARFRLAKSPSDIDLSRYANIEFLERIDPAVKHRPLAAIDAVPDKGPEFVRNQTPGRNWCEDARGCVQSRYKFEGKIPSGVFLVNKLREETKKPIPDFIEFQSEIRLLSPPQPEASDMASLTALETPVAGVIEQNIFWVNQILQFGKLVAVLQEHPTDRSSSIVSVYLVLAVRDDVLSKQRNYAEAPVLRNLVPAQLLMGRSSFNTGNSISAGLPQYARSRIKAIAGIIEGD